jgi:hypothetical protein
MIKSFGIAQALVHVRCQGKRQNGARQGLTGYCTFTLLESFDQALPERGILAPKRYTRSATNQRHSSHLSLFHIGAISIHEKS